MCCALNCVLWLFMIWGVLVKHNYTIVVLLVSGCVVVMGVDCLLVVD